MTKTLMNLQDLRGQIYLKAKFYKMHRFWGIFVHTKKIETLREAYRIAKRNEDASGIDGLTFDDIEEAGLGEFLAAIPNDLFSGSYSPWKNRKVEIPKRNGKVRTIQIPTIRDRVVQGALKLILEAIFEANFCPNSYGFRPNRSLHRALAEVRRSVLRRMTRVIDVDLTNFFDSIRHSVLMDKIARRVKDPEVMRLVKQIIKTDGKTWVPQGCPFSPLAVNIYLTDLDWYFDGIRQKTAEVPYEAINYHRFADDIVITVSGHNSKRGWIDLAVKRLKEQLKPLGVSLNEEKTQIVDMLTGESFGFLGFDFRRVLNRQRTDHFILMTPKKKSRQSIKAEIREIIRQGRASQVKEIFARINFALAGRVNYFRVGNSNQAFSEVRDYLVMKVRTLLSGRKRRQKLSVGWRRWSNEYLYDILELFWDWKLNLLGNVEAYT